MTIEEVKRRTISHKLSDIIEDISFQQFFFHEDEYMNEILREWEERLIEIYKINEV